MCSQALSLAWMIWNQIKGLVPDLAAFMMAITPPMYVWIFYREAKEHAATGKIRPGSTTANALALNRLAERLTRRLPKWSLSVATYYGMVYWAAWVLYSIIYFSYWGSVLGIAASDWILAASSKPWFALVAILLAWVLYVLRNRIRFAYALLEIIIGIAAIWSSVLTRATPGIAHLIAIFGGIYIPTSAVSTWFCLKTRRISRVSRASTKLWC
jgi:hypothetical protein